LVPFTSTSIFQVMLQKRRNHHNNPRILDLYFRDN